MFTRKFKRAPAPWCSSSHKAHCRFRSRYAPLFKVFFTFFSPENNGSFCPNPPKSKLPSPTKTSQVLPRLDAEKSMNLTGPGLPKATRTWTRRFERLQRLGFCSTPSFQPVPNGRILFWGCPRSHHITSAAGWGRAKDQPFPCDF